MARRKKSMRDIEAQYNRIAALNEHLSARDGRKAAEDAWDSEDYVKSYNEGAKRSNERTDRAFEIANGYVDRIKQSKSYRNARLKSKSMTPEGRHNAFEKAVNRKYSQSTYANNGG